MGSELIDPQPEQLVTWTVGGARFIPLDRPVLLGVLNVTPDSFSDGGRYVDASRAVDHALHLIDEGAAVIDIGGESTRPGAKRVHAAEQVDRVIPVVERLRHATEVFISVDTTSSIVAAAALAAGANIINDVSSGLEDPALIDRVAEHGAGLILMHRLVPPDQDSFSDQYDSPPSYDNIVREVAEFLRDRVEFVTGRGVPHRNIVVDPGLGFGKTVEQNYALIARMDEMVTLGCPLLSAASRKSFVGRVSGVDEPAERLAGTLAIGVAHYLAGVRLFRVHDVAAHREALAVADAIVKAAAIPS